jgi:hypothetical protein
MIKSLKTFMLSIFSAGLLVVPVLAPAVVSAAADPQANVCSGAGTLSLSGTSPCQDADASNKVDAIITTVINLFSIIVGIVAVIMIIVGGLKYITSGGDSTAVSTAKNSILYAIIGLIIVALAQILVRFVLTKATAP